MKKTILLVLTIALFCMLIMTSCRIFGSFDITVSEDESTATASTDATANESSNGITTDDTNGSLPTLEDLFGGTSMPDVSVPDTEISEGATGSSTASQTPSSVASSNDSSEPVSSSRETSSSESSIAVTSSRETSSSESSTAVTSSRETSSSDSSSGSVIVIPPVTGNECTREAGDENEVCGKCGSSWMDNGQGTDGKNNCTCNCHDGGWIKGWY